MEQGSNSIDDRINDWNRRYNKINNLVFYVYFFDEIILLLSSSITFFLVIYQRRTRDLFAVASLTSYILASAFLAIYTFVVFAKYLSKDPPVVLVALESLGRMFYLIAHWSFSS